MLKIERIHSAIAAEGLDGWLFHNFHHRDPVADAVLGVEPGRHNSRPWFCMVPHVGPPVRIVHAIERNVLDHVPGELLTYASRDELLSALRHFSGRRLGAHYSETISAISHLDYGTALLVASAGIAMVPADSLIQRLFGVLDEAGFSSHEEAAGHLYRIVDLVWKRIADHFHAGTRLTEYDVQRWILEYFGQFGLVTDHPPIVACGPNSGDPHYEPGPESRAFARGDAVQIDLWAKLGAPGSIYADISWVGVYDTQPGERIRSAFADLAAARDSGFALIAQKLQSGTALTGADVDATVRRCLCERGHESALRHRTGHGIDVECHGSGVNLDSVEFPDYRRIIEGSCFSIEPGVYYPDFGLRTEIDVYVRDGLPIISGGTPQQVILTCE